MKDAEHTSLEEEVHFPSQMNRDTRKWQISALCNFCSRPTHCISNVVVETAVLTMTL